MLLVGPSGAGKSTLLRAIAGLLLTAGHGDLSGTVRIGGRPVGAPGGASIGLLLQDPSAGLVAETVGRDVAFGLENRGVPRDRIWPRVATALTQAAFPYGPDHPTAALSGGELQRLALAGHLALDSRVTLLDEPTSMLDEAAAQTVRLAIRGSASRRGDTVVIVEHRIEPWLDFADRLVVLGMDGTLVADGAPGSVLRERGPEMAALGVWVPGLGPPAPLVVGSRLVEPYRPDAGSLVVADDIRVELLARLAGGAGSTRTALSGVGAALVGGRALAVTGPSGAGKSTLMAVLAGLLRPSAGRVTAASSLAAGTERRPWRWSSRELVSRLSWVPQLPEHGVVSRTVADEVMASARSAGHDLEWAAGRADGLLEALGLSHLREVSPYHLSGGEQRRLMVAASLVHGPAGVLFDEPTVGQDRLTWAAVVGAAAAARDAGSGVALASHDATATGALADDTLLLDKGVSVR